MRTEGLVNPQAGHCLCVSPSTVKSILYGNSKNPGVVTIKQLCDGLDVSLAEFFAGEEFANLEQEIQ